MVHSKTAGCKILLFVWKRMQINEKEARDGSIKTTLLIPYTLEDV